MSGATPGLSQISIAPLAIDVESIDRELDRFWRESRRARREDETIGRAAMSNLLVVVGAPAEAGALAEDLARIVQTHPARIQVLVVDFEQPDAPVEARVAAQCHVLERRWRVCSEHIEIRAGAGAARSLLSVVRSLLVGDLPTALWLPGGPALPAQRELAAELAALADRVVYDAARWPGALGAARGAGWRKGMHEGPACFDMAWTRVLPWRRAVVESLRAAGGGATCPAIDEVVVEHAQSGASGAELLLGWLGGRLDWRPAELENARRARQWRLQSPSGAVRAEIRPVRAAGDAIVSVAAGYRADAEERRATIRAVRRSALEVSFGGGAERLPFSTPAPSRARLAASALSASGPDPLYLEAIVFLDEVFGGDAS